MAQNENTKLVQSLYDAFAQGNVPYLLDHVTEDVEWVDEGPESIPYAGRYRGPAEVKRFFEQLGGSIQGGKVTTQEFIAAEDQVVGLGRFTGTVTATGKKIDAAIAHVFTLRGACGLEAASCDTRPRNVSMNSGIACSVSLL